MKYFSKYLSALFIVAMFMGAFHHHDDLKQHNDCQICTIANNLLNIDTPTEVSYFSELTLQSESIIARLTDIHQKAVLNTFNPRAPPFFS